MGSSMLTTEISIQCKEYHLGYKCRCLTKGILEIAPIERDWGWTWFEVPWDIIFEYPRIKMERESDPPVLNLENQPPILESQGWILESPWNHFSQFSNSSTPAGWIEVTGSNRQRGLGVPSVRRPPQPRQKTEESLAEVVTVKPSKPHDGPALFLPSKYITASHRPAFSSPSTYKPASTPTTRWCASAAASSARTRRSIIQR
jgi:hypothetical protein